MQANLEVLAYADDMVIMTWSLLELQSDYLHAEREEGIASGKKGKWPHTNGIQIEKYF